MFAATLAAQQATFDSVAARFDAALAAYGMTDVKIGKS
jgi:hypothetical protein